jgi:hypothetical protein
MIVAAYNNPQKVVDVRPCDRWGDLKKGGRYVVVRQWDFENDDFAENSTRRAFKPADLRSWEAVKQMLIEKSSKAREVAKKMAPTIKMLVHFFESIGMSNVLTVGHETDLLTGEKLATSFSIRSYGVGSSEAAGGWGSTVEMLLYQFGVIEENPMKESV